jgi:hypothetical protein
MGYLRPQTRSGYTNSHRTLTTNQNITLIQRLYLVRLELGIDKPVRSRELLPLTLGPRIPGPRIVLLARSFKTHLTMRSPVSLHTVFPPQYLSPQ